MHFIFVCFHIWLHLSCMFSFPTARPALDDKLQSVQAKPHPLALSQ